MDNYATIPVMIVLGLLIVVAGLRDARTHGAPFSQLLRSVILIFVGSSIFAAAILIATT